MANFTIKAFYEKEAEISAAVQESYHRYFNLKADKTRRNMNPEQFIEGLDIPMMYREMYWAAEGYLWEMVQRGNVDREEMEKGFTMLMNFWKSMAKTRTIIIFALATLWVACTPSNTPDEGRVASTMAKSAKRGVAFNFVVADDLPLLSSANITVTQQFLSLLKGGTI